MPDSTLSFVEVSNDAVLFPRRCPKRVRLYWRCPCRDRQTDVMMIAATAISATEEFILRNCCDVWRISDSPVRYVAFDIDKSFTGNHVAKQALLRCLSCLFTGWNLPFYMVKVVLFARSTKQNDKNRVSQHFGEWQNRRCWPIDPGFEILHAGRVERKANGGERAEEVCMKPTCTTKAGVDNVVVKYMS